MANNSYPFDPTPEVTFGAVLTSGMSIAEQHDAVEAAWLVLSTGIVNSFDNATAIFTAYLGAGRFVGSTIDPATNPVAGTGLTVRLPNAAYLIQGRYFVVNEPEPTPYAVLPGIVPSQEADVFFGINPDTGALFTKPEWQFTTFPATTEELATVAGLGHIGRVTSDGSGVTALVPSTLDGRGIIRPRGSGSGGEGGISQETLDAAIAALRAEMLAAIAALAGQIVPGVKPAQQPIEHFVHEGQISRDAIARLEVEVFGRAEIIERSQSAAIGAEFGSGEVDGPSFEGPGSMPKNEGDGTFGV